MASEHIWMRARLTETRDSANSAAVQLHCGTGGGQRKASPQEWVLWGSRGGPTLLGFFTTALISEGAALGLCQQHFCMGVMCSGTWQFEGWNRAMEHVQDGGKVC